MANCAYCSAELKFANTPILGAGKLKSGERLCLDCLSKIVKIDSSIQLSKLTADDLRAVFTSSAQKTGRIDSQLQKIGFSQSSAIWGRKELAELPAIIAEGEEIFSLIQGTYNGGVGILVATDRRLVFIDKGMIYGLKVEDFGLDKISSIQLETGILLADIKIMASGNVAKISNVDKGEGRIFCDKVRAKLSEPKQPAAPVVVQQQIDVADQLMKLAALKEQGILTQEEFDAQKKKLLGM